MKAQEIKEKFFKPFIDFLDKIGIGDHFSMDIWMSKAWDRLYEAFQESEKDNYAVNKYLTMMTVEDARKFLAEKEKQERNKIVTPDKKIIKP